jgi:fatty-acyl-CoA synthase
VKGLIAGARAAGRRDRRLRGRRHRLTHVYGLTEVYGPAAVCAKQAAWDACRARSAPA